MVIIIDIFQYNIILLFCYSVIVSYLYLSALCFSLLGVIFIFTNAFVFTKKNLLRKKLPCAVTRDVGPSVVCRNKFGTRF